MWVCFDVDRPGSGLDWYDRGAPPPTLVMENPRNGHAHLAYALEAPVPKTEAARLKPLLYLASTKEGIRRVVGGDVGVFRGGLSKPQARSLADAILCRHLRAGRPGRMGDAAQPCRDFKKARDPTMRGLAETAWLFEMLRAYGYKAVRKYWRPRVRAFRQGHGGPRL